MVLDCCNVLVMFFLAQPDKRVTLPPVGPCEFVVSWGAAVFAETGWTGLRSGEESSSAIGASLGYLSDSAFCAAFNKVVGVSPRAYRDSARASIG